MTENGKSFDLEVPVGLDERLVNLQMDVPKGQNPILGDPKLISPMAKGNFITINLAPPEKKSSLVAYMYHPIFVKGDDTTMSIGQAILKYDNNTFSSSFPIASSGNGLSVSPAIFSFVAPDKTSLYIIAKPLDRQSQEFAGDRFVGKWILDKGVYSLQGYAPCTFPPDINDRTFRTNMQFFNLKFPWFVLPTSSYLLNVENNKQLKLEMVKTKSGPRNLFNASLFVDEGNNRVYRVVLLDNEAYLVVNHKSTGAIISSVSLKKELLNYFEFNTYTFSEDGKSLYYLDRKGNVWNVYLPLIIDIGD